MPSAGRAVPSATTAAPVNVILSLAAAVKPTGPPSTLAHQISKGLKNFGGPATILIAENDRTAQAFLAHWDKGDNRLRKCPGAGHSFIEPQARIWLQGQILAALRGVSA